MDIRIDYSPVSTLALCSCGWRIARWDRAAAWIAAGEHALAAHDDPDESQACRDKGWQILKRRRR